MRRTKRLVSSKPLRSLNSNKLKWAQRTVSYSITGIHFKERRLAITSRTSTTKETKANIRCTNWWNTSVMMRSRSETMNSTSVLISSSQRWVLRAVQSSSSTRTYWMQSRKSRSSRTTTKMEKTIKSSNVKSRTRTVTWKQSRWVCSESSRHKSWHGMRGTWRGKSRLKISSRLRKQQRRN